MTRKHLWAASRHASAALLFFLLAGCLAGRPGANSTCRGPGWYEAGKEGSYAPCCDGLREVLYAMANDPGGPNERNCIEPLCRIYGCVAGTCGDGTCEPGEAGRCGCELDCPSATWELKNGPGPE